MRKRYIIGGIIIITFLILAILSFDESKIEYSDIPGAVQSGKTVQIIGKWDKSLDYNYDADNNIFSFSMTDEKNNSIPVEFAGMKPNNFNTAPNVVVKGRVENGVFHADHILTKCPSKYEGSAEEHQY